jgi:hypothetical protein
MPRHDDLLDAAYRRKDDIQRAYRQWKDKKPIAVLHLAEQRIYVFPYREFKADLSAADQASLEDQYELAVAGNKIVVFIQDNERKRLVSFSMVDD